jgi:hypothetical protein
MKNYGYKNFARPPLLLADEYKEKETYVSINKLTGVIFAIQTYAPFYSGGHQRRQAAVHV